VPSPVTPFSVVGSAVFLVKHTTRTMWPVEIYIERATIKNWLWVRVCVYPNE
jgi:hypothetical protein